MNWAGLSQALRTKAGYEVATATPSDKQLRLLGRAPQDRMGDMLLLIHALKSAVEQSPGWDVDISKTYILRNGKVVFGWRFIFQSADDQGIGAHLNDIARVVCTRKRAQALLGLTNPQG